MHNKLVNKFLVLLHVILSFIAKGLAMCRLGGVISAQKVLFWTLFITGFEHF